MEAGADTLFDDSVLGARHGVAFVVLTVVVVVEQKWGVPAAEGVGVGRLDGLQAAEGQGVGLLEGLGQTKSMVGGVKIFF
jgi:hypothetical protein